MTTRSPWIEASAPTPSSRRLDRGSVIVPPFKETQGYVKKVNELLPTYRRQFASRYADKDAVASR